MYLSMLGRHRNLALLLVRLSLGATFLIHGYMKVQMWQADPAAMTTTFKILAIAEPLGGLAVLLGVLTRYAALGLAIIMLGAIYMKIVVWGGGIAGFTAQGGWEFDLSLLASSAVLLAYGPGRHALDQAMGWDKRE